MKVILTEGQYTRIQALLENEQGINEFRNHCQIKSKEVDKIYLQVASISIYEILNGNTDYYEVYRVLNTIEDSILIREKNLITMIGDDDETGLEDIVDEICKIPLDKCTSLGLILLDICKLQESHESHNLIKAFENIMPTTQSF